MSKWVTLVKWVTVNCDFILGDMLYSDEMRDTTQMTVMLWLSVPLFVCTYLTNIMYELLSDSSIIEDRYYVFCVGCGE